MKNFQHLMLPFSDHLQRYSEGLSERQPPELYEPVSYMLGLGGKRVRPLLVLAGAELAGGNPNAALDAALSVELFHNFSLVHDDILDNATLRRNHPTVHKKFGSNLAILVGDVMLVEAFKSLDSYPDPVYRSLCRLLQTTSVEVCEGQQLDMNFEKSNQVSARDYVDMITLKTAVLLGCSLQMGAICAKGSQNDQQHLYEFGKHLGIAFQLLDDLMDCFPPSGSFGKQVGGDIMSRKKTYLVLKAMELGGRKERSTLRDYYEGSEQASPKLIGEITGIFRQVKADELCRNEAGDHTRQAIRSLDRIGGDPVKKAAMGEFAHDLLNRTA